MLEFEGHEQSYQELLSFTIWAVFGVTLCFFIALFTLILIYIWKVKTLEARSRARAQDSEVVERDRARAQDSEVVETSGKDSESVEASGNDTDDNRVASD